VEALAHSPLAQWLLGLGWIDRIALTLVVIAFLRGLAIGLLREAFSLAALASAFAAIRLFADPFASWLMDHAFFGLELRAHQARLAAGALLGLVTVLGVGGIGAFVRARVHAVGLGVVDRLAGGVLGTLEGGLVVAALLIALSAVAGPDHAILGGCRSLELLARARAAAGVPAPDVAAPPPPERESRAPSPSPDAQAL
jgi:uncharacterized membrane protein required for colicin V production